MQWRHAAAPFWKCAISNLVCWWTLLLLRWLNSVASPGPTWFVGERFFCYVDSIASRRRVQLGLLVNASFVTLTQSHRVAGSNLVCWWTLLLLRWLNSVASPGPTWFVGERFFCYVDSIDRVAGSNLVCWWTLLLLRWPNSVAAGSNLVCWWTLLLLRWLNSVASPGPTWFVGERFFCYVDSIASRRRVQLRAI